MDSRGEANNEQHGTKSEWWILSGSSIIRSLSTEELNQFETFPTPNMLTKLNVAQSTGRGNNNSNNNNNNSNSNNSSSGRFKKKLRMALFDVQHWDSLTISKEKLSNILVIWEILWLNVDS